MLCAIHMHQTISPHKQTSHAELKQQFQAGYLFETQQGIEALRSDSCFQAWVAQGIPQRQTEVCTRSPRVAGGLAKAAIQVGRVAVFFGTLRPFLGMQSAATLIFMDAVSVLGLAADALGTPDSNSSSAGGSLHSPSLDALKTPLPPEEGSRSASLRLLQGAAKSTVREKARHASLMAINRLLSMPQVTAQTSLVPIASSPSQQYSQTNKVRPIACNQVQDISRLTVSKCWSGDIGMILDEACDNLASTSNPTANCPNRSPANNFNCPIMITSDTSLSPASNLLNPGPLPTTPLPEQAKILPP